MTLCNLLTIFFCDDEGGIIIIKNLFSLKFYRMISNNKTVKRGRERKRKRESVSLQRKSWGRKVGSLPREGTRPKFHSNYMIFSCISKNFSRDHKIKN